MAPDLPAQAPPPATASGRDLATLTGLWLDARGGVWGVRSEAGQVVIEGEQVFALTPEGGRLTHRDGDLTIGGTTLEGVLGELATPLRRAPVEGTWRHGEEVIEIAREGSRLTIRAAGASGDKARRRAAGLRRLRTGSS